MVSWQLSVTLTAVQLGALGLVFWRLRIYLEVRGRRQEDKEKPAIRPQP